MSDAFADLWNSSGASKPAEAPRKLGALAASPIQPAAARRPANDVFSMLSAASSSSSQASRAATPAASYGSSIPAGAPRPMQKSASAGAAMGSGGGDAFSSLLGGSLASQPSTGANLTMAQRAALAEKERRERAQRTQLSASSHTSSAWAGLDVLGSSTSSSANPKVPSASSDLFDDFAAFSGAPAAVPPKASQPPPPDDDWGLGDFGHSAPKPATRTQAAPPPTDLFGLDDFLSGSSSATPPRSNTPGDFDFGNREDGLLGNQSDNDDILGDLGKPVEELTVNQSIRNTPSPQPPRSGQQSRAVSPPPHVLGQIVEMGFSIQQARVALAATDTGLDVQAALETLLANGAGSSSPAPEQQQRRPQREPGHERYYGSDEDERPPLPRRPAATRQGSQGQVPRERAARDATPANGGANANLQEQADKIMAQASEIGLNMFNRANAFWKESKERVQRAYEERQAAPAGPPSRQNGAEPPRRNGSPKWMDDVHPDEAHPESAGPSSGGFRDDDDDEHHRAPPAKPATQPPPSRTREPPAESPSARLKTGDLLGGDDAPAVYVSPFRRKGGSRAQSSTPSPAPSAPTPKPAAPRAPSPAALIQRQTVSASASEIAASAQHKAAGTEKFKLGQYGEAEALYTAALDALPEQHLLRVPLLNNRALTRLKNGDAPGAGADCTAAIALIGPAYHPTKEAPVTRAEHGASVDLADALAKAWRRRAEALEGRERWADARKDWEALLAADFAGARFRQDALAGVGRCRKMLSANGGAGGGASAAAPSKPKPPPAKPKPKPAPARPRVPTPPSEALNRVREANEAAEAEDQARADLKDTVDARLVAWRAGKENNLRALIASLDTVLWPALGWQKVGIHELVSPGQVKVRYTKAIAKLHPDKLNVQNTTVEQRMIANGVFGTLNEAWNAFKP